MPALTRLFLLIALTGTLGLPDAHGQTARPEQPSPQLRVGPLGQAPYVPSWDRTLRRFYERELQRFYDREANFLRPDPYASADRAVRRLYDDPIRKLGLPENRPFRIDPRMARPAAPPALPNEIEALDTDRDGVVTRHEYLDHRFRHRPVAAGPAAEAWRRGYQVRAGARFDGADRNRDGRLTADELRGIADPRF